jgi:hypothetical protein
MNRTGKVERSGISVFLAEYFQSSKQGKYLGKRRGSEKSIFIIRK